MPFKRPENLEFPTTYYTFKVKSRESDEVIEYRVQDLPDDRFEEALELMRTHFLPDESLCSSSGIPDDPVARQIFLDFWIECMKQHLSIACFRNDGVDNMLISVNCFVVNGKDDPEEDIKYENPKVQKIFDFLNYTSEVSDIYSAYNVNQYLTAYGLCVNRKYRGQGIATEMLKARIPYLKKMGLSVTSTAFTAIGSQVAAKKAGYIDFYVKSYEEIKDIDPRFDFRNNSTSTKDFKIMVITADS
ncbi:uncharacterized protein [Chironomus tepperi]|uniref:uncharacterized protein n=1 Tax=Chironomus tepperi TaxID=113505 RepID=UPI00391F25C7